MSSDYDKIITILGAGYVGLTTAVVLANSGYKVNLIELDEIRYQKLISSSSFL